MTGADGNWKKFLFQGVSCLRNEGKRVSQQIPVQKNREAEEDNGYCIAKNSSRQVCTERKTASGVAAELTFLKGSESMMLYR